MKKPMHESAQVIEALPTASSSTRSNPNSETASDGSLLRRFQKGNHDAATQIYVRYAQRLHALASRQCAPDLAVRYDADDVVQSVFRTFFRRAAQGNYDVPDGDELWKLFLVIALNKVRSAGAYHRAARRDVRRTGAGEALDQVPSSDLNDDEPGMVALKLAIEQVLEGLPEGHRRMIEMRIEGYEVGEIAERTGRAKRSVERILQGFRASLTEKIHDDR